MFRRACHQSQSCAGWIQFTLSHPHYSWPILMSSYVCLGVLGGFSISNQNFVWTSHLSPCMLHVLFTSSILIWLSYWYLTNGDNYGACHYEVSSSHQSLFLSLVTLSFSAPCFQVLPVCDIPLVWETSFSYL